MLSFGHHNHVVKKDIDTPDGHALNTNIFVTWVK